MNIYELIKLSIKSLFSFKLRSFLTMLGIIVGISSVVLISSVGAGFQENIIGEATKALSKIVVVEMDSKKFSGLEKKRDYYITKSDLANIEKLPNMESAFFADGDYGTVKELGMQIHKIESDKNLKAYSYKIDYGRSITKEEYENEAKVTILHYDSAILLYKDPYKALGKVIDFQNFEGKTEKYTVIGVTQKPEQENVFKNYSARMFIPYKSKNYENGFSFKVIDESKMTDTIEVIKKYFEVKTGLKDSYKLTPINEQLGEVTGILDKISIFISFIAGISLMVGGIGVMNIMLVSVTERISEIGLRKAIGAKNRHILIQFLVESIILTLIGGIIGVILGYSLAGIVGIFLKIRPILKIKVLLMSLFVSMGTGLIFGIYPAKKASKLSPMEALRSE